MAALSLPPKTRENSAHTFLNEAELHTAPVTTPASVKHYRAGETIYFEGQESLFCYQVITGVVKEYNTLVDGGCQIIDFYTDDQVFGLSQYQTQPHTAQAITDCSVKCFQRDLFLESMAGSPRQAADFMFQLLTRLHRSHDRLVMLGRMTALQRLAIFLLRLSKTQHAQSETIDLRMTRQDIADYLGLTIETVSRAFGELKKLGWIQLLSSRRLKILDAKALAASVSGTSTQF